MNDTYVISKMNEYMHLLSGRMSEWMSGKLPKLTDAFMEVQKWKT